MIDLYCERLDSSFWAEPINALTNVAFIIAAWGVWRLGCKQKAMVCPIWVLLTLMVSIGIGSFLFHTYATKLTMILDIVPILVFQLVFIWVYSQRIIQLPLSFIIGLLVVYIGLSLFAGQFSDIFNGSLSYLPVILILSGFGLYHFYTKKTEKVILLVALAIFLLALFFRTIDMIVCPYFPIGTHFIWHMINGVLVYLSVRSLIVNITP